MASVKIPEQQRTLTGYDDVAGFLAARGIEYERWHSERNVGANATSDAVLLAYKDKVDELSARGGYTAADVIDVKPDTPNLEPMLAKFSREHWHDEDEVRFIVEGRGIFHIHQKDAPVFAIEVEAGDLIRVPRGTLHWFDLCSTKHIQCIRLFQDPGGWTPWYTESGLNDKFEPVCLGRAFVA